MIRFAIFLAFLLSFSMSYGQGPINIGIKFGTNRSTMITNFDDVLNQNIIYEDVNNYLAGAFARISLGRLYLQPEAYFNTKGGIIKPYGSDQSPDPSTTSISYQIPEAGNVVIKIFDTIGREIQELVNEYKSEGYFKVVFDATNLSSGIYYYQLRSSNFIGTKKMILLR